MFSTEVSARLPLMLRPAFTELSIGGGSGFYCRAATVTSSFFRAALVAATVWVLSLSVVVLVFFALGAVGVYISVACRLLRGSHHRCVRLRYTVEVA